MRITSHKRLIGRFGQLSTNRDHMPDNHKLYIDQTPENAKDWADEIGPNTLKVIDFLLGTAQTERLALQSIFTLKKLER
ncbi:IS21 family transposase, partial [Exiguobacterium sp. MER 193]|nr:IS21 family transposase [Exiguobacterium sp. MER 193]